MVDAFDDDDASVSESGAADVNLTASNYSDSGADVGNSAASD